MSWSFSLFKIRGITLKVHLTFFLILVWAAYRWGIGLNAGPNGALYGVVVITLLFVCVTIHELAHSLTSIRFGGKVRDIVLLPIGGVSQIEKMPDKPRQELWMALIGPLTNFVIAAALTLLELALGHGSPFSQARFESILKTVSWGDLIAYVTITNVFLGVFNLLPAFPMDGGRVLRAFLALRMDYAKATAWAVNIGQGLSWLMGLFGVLSGNWTLVIIAVFIYLGAGQEGRGMIVRDVLGQIRVRQVMTAAYKTLAPADPLSKAADLILHTFQEDFPVLEGERMVGILQQRDLIVALKRGNPGDEVAASMKREFPAAAPADSLFEAQQKMGAAGFSTLPVFDGGRLVGLMTMRDVSEAYLLLTASPHLLEGR